MREKCSIIKWDCLCQVVQPTAISVTNCVTVIKEAGGKELLSKFITETLLKFVWPLLTKPTNITRKEGTISRSFTTRLYLSYVGVKQEMRGLFHSVQKNFDLCIEKRMSYIIPILRRGARGHRFDSKVVTYQRPVTAKNSLVIQLDHLPCIYATVLHLKNILLESRVLELMPCPGCSQAVWDQRMTRSNDDDAVCFDL